MNLYKMIEICVKDDNMHTFIIINALICINNYVITCINSMLSIHNHDMNKPDWQFRDSYGSIQWTLSPKSTRDVSLVSPHQ